MPVLYLAFSFSLHIGTSFKDGLELFDDGDVRHQDNIHFTSEITSVKKVVDTKNDVMVLQLYLKIDQETKEISLKLLTLSIRQRHTGYPT